MAKLKKKAGSKARTETSKKVRDKKFGGSALVKKNKTKTTARTIARKGSRRRASPMRKGINSRPEQVIELIQSEIVDLIDQRAPGTTEIETTAVPATAAGQENGQV